MTKPRTQTASATAERWYRGDKVPMAAIRKFARQVAEQFHPDQVILFGSHAYGTPTATWTFWSSCRRGTAGKRR